MGKSLAGNILPRARSNLFFLDLGESLSAGFEDRIRARNLENFYILGF